MRSLVCALVLCAAAGCGASPAEPAAPAPAPEAPAASAAAPAASSAPIASAPSASDGIALEKQTEARFAILLPKGSKMFAKSETGGVLQMNYSYALDASKTIEAHVNVGAGTGAASLDDAVRTATMMGTKDIAAKKELGGGRFLVVKAVEGKPPLDAQEVFLFAKDAMVKCDGPAKYTATLTAVCSSFEPH